MSKDTHDDYSKTLLGFWLYLVSDFMLFGALFATYIVLKNNIFGSISSQELYDINNAYFQSILFLLIAFYSGCGSLAAHCGKKTKSLVFFILVFLLGAFFLWNLLCEFSSFIGRGYSWKESGFLSGYFSLNGIFALHVTAGLIWTLGIILPLFFRDYTEVSLRRVACLKMFWQFLNIIWIFIFSVVYLLGVV
jgi:cytochrome o ubiquinol oxidase subunit III